MTDIAGTIAVITSGQGAGRRAFAVCTYYFWHTSGSKERSACFHAIPSGSPVVGMSAAIVSSSRHFALSKFQIDSTPQTCSCSASSDHRPDGQPSRVVKDGGESFSGFLLAVHGTREHSRTAWAWPPWKQRA